MSPIFLDRSRKGPHPYLQWKVRVFTIGAILAFVGMLSEEEWLVWIAIAVLFVGVLLRLLPTDEEGEGEDTASSPAED